MTTPTPPAIPTPTPAEIGKLAQAALWFKKHWAAIKAKFAYWVQRWKDEPIKTTGYGIVAAVVAFFAAEGIVDSNVTNLVTSLVTLGAGAPVVHAVDTATKANIDRAYKAARALGAHEEAVRQALALKRK